MDIQNSKTKSFFFVHYKKRINYSIKKMLPKYVWKQITNTNINI